MRISSSPSPSNPSEFAVTETLPLPVIVAEPDAPNRMLSAALSAILPFAAAMVPFICKSPFAPVTALLKPPPDERVPPIKVDRCDETFVLPITFAVASIVAELTVWTETDCSIGPFCASFASLKSPLQRNEPTAVPFTTSPFTTIRRRSPKEPDFSELAGVCGSTSKT